MVIDISVDAIHNLYVLLAVEVVTKFMSSQCQLAHNQARQKEVISMYEEVTKGMPESAKVDHKVEDLIPEGCCE